ncbi:MAG: 50S ribosomal protein L18 [Omnitrophica bacterium RIFCSPLOWO2_12_FULL_44_17]|uniref:Large ribosomal subunit protein uL18 n=1 Tax=Candidatus Danuiimicrobium aquiferis TaxID=1801832 RepID=A0A1G1L009_9BACT|nr:MAG: 50S ribosomal protein L18 [Omnitrophica bacterium RIFCSPHIGHO2_02_FULL_45_28]OGW91776.1 MAG: 50S ribosomal protein L18 [Omnitrophica bacterium RIFCSPHIGHO2_12_FULL_44_12]OGW98480.1 MAG: 50S ribosomal protein L18 [Omnitrophica bacterium RIFCSPLOWO2_12_FULL_44_17]OGX02927.1 MAG: 50S ribosomal protein L18 [Omnitrophica bacterium RIFCSPLOWO2_02_FULL_44_11]
MLSELREKALQIRKLRIRKKVTGTAERPRLCVHRSHLNLQVQVVDDMAEKSILSFTTASPAFRSKGMKQAGNIGASKLFGQMVSEELKKKGILKIVFDRGGRPYQGRVKAFAEALRENGIQF